MRFVPDHEGAAVRLNVVDVANRADVQRVRVRVAAVRAIGPRRRAGQCAIDPSTPPRHPDALALLRQFPLRRRQRHFAFAQQLLDEREHRPGQRVHDRLLPPAAAVAPAVAPAAIHEAHGRLVLVLGLERPDPALRRVALEPRGLVAGPENVARRRAERRVHEALLDEVCSSAAAL